MRFEAESVIIYAMATSGFGVRQTPWRLYTPNTAPNASATVFKKAPQDVLKATCRTRTDDLRITNALLYQLS